ncbi:M48 family metallopeptidase [Micromonospora sp. NPDC003197]
MHPPVTAARDDTSTCARCSSATVSIRGAIPWCPRCEWNLDRYDPNHRAPEFGWRWVDRRTHQLAYRLTRRQFTELAEQSLDRPRLNLARITTVTVSLLLVAGVVALAVGGGWLVTYRFPSLATVFGVAALGLAIALRPRLGKLDPLLDVLPRDQAPALHQLIDEVATAVGAPRPDVVAVDNTFNAYATSVGLRRRRVLCLGLPLWGSLGPQERVALLGHELGHFVNGDIRRGLLTQPAFTMLGSAADLVRPIDTVGGGDGVGFVGVIGDMLQSVLSRLLFGAHLRQLSVRDDVSLFASHPPAGLRARMIETRQWRTATVVLTETRSEQIDAELVKDYERTRRTISWAH